MKVTVKTKALLERAKENRRAYQDHLRALCKEYVDKHPRPSINKWARDQYKRAGMLSRVEKDRKEDREALEKALDRILRLEDLPKGIVDRTSEYDRVIEALEWHQQDAVELTQDEFNRLARDEWGWDTRPKLTRERHGHLRRVS